MVRCSPVLKAQIISEHLDKGSSGAELGRKYNLPIRRVQDWIQNYHLGGIQTVKYHVLAGQISIWWTTFLRVGFAGLKARPKGRSTKMKPTKKQLKQIEKQSEIERLRSELVHKSKNFMTLNWRTTF